MKSSFSVTLLQAECLDRLRESDVYRHEYAGQTLYSLLRRGWIYVKDGRISLTEVGREVVESGLKVRKYFNGVKLLSDKYGGSFKYTPAWQGTDNKGNAVAAYRHGTSLKISYKGKVKQIQL